MPHTSLSGGLSSQGRMRSARPLGRGVNVAPLEASPPGRLLVSTLTRKSWDHPACGKEARPGEAQTARSRSSRTPPAVEKDPPSWETQRWLLAEHHRAGKGRGGGSHRESQGGSWPALTCILQSICYLHCELPGPRGQLLAPANSARGLGSGPRQALPPPDHGQPTSLRGSRVPQVPQRLLLVWETRPLAVPRSEVK